MAKINRFEDLQSWQEARMLVKDVYLASMNGPICRDFGLKDQIRRASVSTMSNIAEGFGRFSHREFARFLEISGSSANEVKSLGYVAIDLEYWSEEVAFAIQKRAEAVRSLDMGLIRYLKTSDHRI